MGESFVEEAASMGYPPDDWDYGEEDTGFTPSSPQSYSEIPSNFSEQELIDILLDEVRDVSSDAPFFCSQYPDPFCGHLPLEHLDGMNLESKELRAYYFTYKGGNFSARILASALRRSGLPFFYFCDEVTSAVWSEDDGCIRVHNRSGPQNWIRLSSEPESESNQFAVACVLVQRALLTTDHGFKPLIVNVNDEDAIAAGRPVSRVLVSSISEANFDNYSLAYFTASGSVKFLPLRAAYQACADEVIPLCTRIGTYDLDGGDTLHADLTWARLKTDAFLLIRSRKPSEVAFFSADTEGTIYQPHIRRLLPQKHCELFEPFCNLDEDSLTAFERSFDIFDQHAQVYVTCGLHPLERRADGRFVSLVTTLQLYFEALASLYKLGAHIDLSGKSPTIGSRSKPLAV